MKLSKLLKFIGCFCVLASILIIMNLYKLKQDTIQTRKAHSKELELFQLGIQFEEASDYLTDQSRAFAQFGEQKHYNNYWKEINEKQARQKIILRLEDLDVSPDELSLLEKALKASDSLS